MVPLGVFEVEVDYEGQTAKLNLYVVEKGGPALFGRDWLQKIQLNWKNIKCLHHFPAGENLDNILKCYPSVFQDGIGSVKDIKASLHLKPDTKPKFMKPRPVAYSLKPKVEEELDKLEKQGIIYKVDTSEWATPIVAIPKKDSSVRICGDFKVTLNPALQVDQYPLPKIEDIFANLAGGEKFTKLDLRQAYLQLHLSEDSKPLLTINTHKGLYRYHRMTYGISPAPSIWQRTIDTILQGCLLWGIRVIIPRKLQDKVLNLLHSTHPGIVRMKSLARSYVFWPGIDKDIEHLVKQCSGCQKQQNAPEKAFLHPWEWPSSPWERVHVDFAGPFMNRMFFIMVDAHSKWPEIVMMKSTTTAKTIEVMRTIFARNGLCKQLVSDNGPQFISEEFAQFMKSNGILHLKSAAYHAATNGQAERLVQSFKNSMRAMKSEPGDIGKKIANFLLSYRNTVHSTTNETPAKLFLGRNLRTRLDLLKPDVKKTVTDSQMKVTFSSTKGKDREFKVGQSVIARDYRDKEKWIPGRIEERIGPLMYKVDTGSNYLWRRHADQLRESNLGLMSDTQSVMPTETILPTVQTDMGQSQTEQHVEQAIPVVVSSPMSSEVAQQNKPILQSDKTVVETERSYPLRIRKPPKRLEL